MRILIVDDELVSREKLRNMMDSFGQCIVVENGADALRVATSQNPPDLILLDIMMPGMDGYEVCKRLKSSRRTSNIPVIFISVRSGEDDEAQGLGLGAVDYITKPFSPSIVKARVRTHLELKKHRNRLEELVNERTVKLKKATKEMQVEIAERKQAEEALRESEEKYRNIFNNAQVGIFRTRISDGKVLECNDRFARTYGYKTPEECKDDFVVSEHYADPGTRDKIVASLMEKGEVNDIEACFSRKDGDYVWVRFFARAFPEEGYLEGVGYDITCRLPN